MLDNRALIKTQSRLHRLVYRWTGGLIGSRLGRSTVLLLTTTGRRSGQSRTTPLIYVRDGAGYVVIASNAGNDAQPSWWLNLQADPAARVQAGRRVFDARARLATSAERARLWAAAIKSYPTYARYQQRTSREI